MVAYISWIDDSLLIVHVYVYANFL